MKQIKQDGARVSALPVVIFCELEKNLYCVRAGDRKAVFRDPFRLFWFLESCRNSEHVNTPPENRPALVCFVNDFKAFSASVYLKWPEATKAGTKRQAGNEMHLEIKTPHIIFRNFDAIANGTARTVAEMFHTVNVLDAMAALLDELAGGRCWSKIRWSLAYQAKREFFKDIRAELWEDMKEKQVLFKSLLHYRDMFCGNKGGLLLLYASDEHKKKLRTVFRNVHSYDKKSAYPAIMVSDELFPLGAIKKITRNKVDCLKARMRERQWFKIVIETKKRIKELDLFEGERENGERRYGLEWYDFRALVDCLNVSQKRIEEILNENYWGLYISAETGMLPDCLRFKIVERYTEKELFDRSSPRRFFIKTQIDMIIGKGLQWHDFRTVSAVNRHYIGRGENYIMPQHSMHCIAAVRYELMCLIRDIGSTALYWDTDGLKAESGMIEEIIKRKNENICALNWMELGFKQQCNIGIWDFEGAGDFMPLGPKSYLFKPKDGPLVFKHCGLADKDAQRYLQSIKTPFEHFKKQREIETKGGYSFNTRSRKYHRESVLFTL